MQEKGPRRPADELAVGVVQGGLAVGDLLGHADDLAAEGVGLALVLPMQMCPLPGPLYTVLMGYKEAPVAEARAHFGPLVRSLT
ncbi:MAG TPA: hypothetical protein VHZ05_12075, partial [Acidimicrobiales bacterium]|nr:hypothetical protein [Acidimicrobiales bacterium]